MLPNRSKQRESETKRVREGIKRMIEKKKETEREIAWKRKNQEDKKEAVTHRYERQRE